MPCERVSSFPGAICLVRVDWRLRQGEPGCKGKACLRVPPPVARVASPEQHGCGQHSIRKHELKGSACVCCVLSNTGRDSRHSDDQKPLASVAEEREQARNLLAEAVPDLISGREPGAAGPELPAQLKVDGQFLRGGGRSSSAAASWESGSVPLAG